MGHTAVLHPPFDEVLAAQPNHLPESFLSLAIVCFVWWCRSIQLPCQNLTDQSTKPAFVRVLSVDGVDRKVTLFISNKN